MKNNDPVIYQGREYVVHQLLETTIVIRPKHSTITGDCIEVTPDRILIPRKSIRFTEIQEVQND